MNDCRRRVRLIHTSDWHIGRMLYGRKRYEEFSAFLDWLAQTVSQREVHVLLVAGDIFDTTAPSNRSQELYYGFLCRIARSSCRHIVIVAGNHDSPSFLNAPRQLLRSLNVHVFGNVSETPENEVVVLRDQQHIPELIVCAVPYLRDKDIRKAEDGESIEDKERKLIAGICDRYAAVGAIAERLQAEFGLRVPIIGMGHLFTAGGETVSGDGVRDLYVGSLAHVPASIFPPCFDYLALGHLHVPQKVNGSSVQRYSGSPLPMGFGESRQAKLVCEVELEGRAVAVQEINVPVFQKLERVQGDWNAISQRIADLAMSGSRAWLEVIYESREIIGDLRERLDAAIAGTNLELLRTKNTRLTDQVLEQVHVEETLNDLDETEVFERCLAVNDVADEQRPELRDAYQEILKQIRESDVHAV